MCAVLFVINTSYGDKMTVKKGCPKQPWQKNLYSNRGYPDNYTDESFLRDLRKNVDVEFVGYKKAVLGAGLVTQELCSVVLFSVLFVYLDNSWVEPESVFFHSSILTNVGYVAYRVAFTNDGSFFAKVWDDFIMVLIFLAFGYVLSPILKTLTDTISTDTIYAMAALMGLIHLVFCDYGVAAAIVSPALSLNAAIFGSVCLASRLATPFHAFVLLTVSVEFYALLPHLLHGIGGSFVVLSSMVCLASVVLWSVSVTMTVVFWCTVTFTTVLCPIWFVRSQCHKETIYGPWDEAVVENSVT